MGHLDLSCIINAYLGPLNTVWDFWTLLEITIRDIQKTFSYIRASFCLMSLNEGSTREDRECWLAGHSREEVCWRPTQTRLSAAGWQAPSRVPPWQIFHQMTNGTLRPGLGPALRIDLANVRLACQGSTPAPSLQCWSQIDSHSN